MVVMNASYFSPFIVASIFRDANIGAIYLTCAFLLHIFQQLGRFLRKLVGIFSLPTYQLILVPATPAPVKS